MIRGRRLSTRGWRQITTGQPSDRATQNRQPKLNKRSSVRFDSTRKLREPKVGRTGGKKTSHRQKGSTLAIPLAPDDAYTSAGRKCAATHDINLSLFFGSLNLAHVMSKATLSTCRRSRFPGLRLRPEPRREKCVAVISNKWDGRTDDAGRVPPRQSPPPRRPHVVGSLLHMQQHHQQQQPSRPPAPRILPRVLLRLFSWLVGFASRRSVTPPPSSSSWVGSHSFAM